MATRLVEPAVLEPADPDGTPPHAVGAAAAATAGALDPRRWLPRLPQRDPAQEEREARELLELVTGLVAKKLPDDSQHAVARVLDLLTVLRAGHDAGFHPQLRIALQAMQADAANLVFVTDTLRSVEFNVRRNEWSIFRFVYRVAGPTPLGALMSGLIFNLLTLAFLVGAIKWLFAAKSEAMLYDFTVITPVVLAAAFGSFTSIFVRLPELARKQDDTFLTFLTAYVKPFVGMGFALFAILCLRAKIITVIGLPDTIETYLALAFLCGFSERIASDFVANVEGRLPTRGAGATVADGGAGGALAAPPKP